jgi:archaellum component FlaC
MFKIFRDRDKRIEDLEQSMKTVMESVLTLTEGVSYLIDQRRQDGTAGVNEGIKQLTDQLETLKERIPSLTGSPEIDPREPYHW